MSAITGIGLSDWSARWKQKKAPMLVATAAISHGEVSAAAMPSWPARPVSALIDTSAAPYRIPPVAASISLRRCLNRSRHAPAQIEALRSIPAMRNAWTSEREAKEHMAHA
jgi:hypothetical protein